MEAAVRSGEETTTAREPVGKSVSDVVRALVLHPKESLLQKWNWKAAILASVLRGVIFFAASAKAGWHAAASAMLVEFIFRALTSGFWGAMTQAFEGAEPVWLATVCALILVPVVSHSLELAVHLLKGTPHLFAGMLSSVIFTAISTLFNLYAMRRGAMRVGAGSRSFQSDMAQMPRLIAGFVAVGPQALWRAMSGTKAR